MKREDLLRGLTGRPLAAWVRVAAGHQGGALESDSLHHEHTLSRLQTWSMLSAADYLHDLLGESSAIEGDHPSLTLPNGSRVGSGCLPSYSDFPYISLIVEAVGIVDYPRVGGGARVIQALWESREGGREGVPRLPHRGNFHSPGPVEMQGRRRVVGISRRGWGGCPEISTS